VRPSLYFNDLLRALLEARPARLGYGLREVFPYSGGAVYLFSLPDDSLGLYLGMTGNLQQRMYQHADDVWGTQECLAVRIKRYPHYPQDVRDYLVRYVEIVDYYKRRDFEHYALERVNPPLNRRL
jgi:hypothetical protein